MATLRDVAQRSGVSTAAASYVLSGRRSRLNISPETQERIRRAAQELGYRPSAVARALVTKRTDTLALVMQYATFYGVWHGFTGELVRAAAGAGLAHGLDLMLRTRKAGTAEEEAAAIADGRCDCALIFRDPDDPLPGLLL